MTTLKAKTKKIIVPRVLVCVEKKISWLPLWFPGNAIEHEISGSDEACRILGIELKQLVPSVPKAATRPQVQPSEWRDWKSNTVTKAFFRCLDGLKYDMEQRMGQGKCVDPLNADHTQLESGVAVGFIRAVDKILDLAPEPSEMEGDEE